MQLSRLAELSGKTYYLIAALFVLAAGSVLFLMGQVPICECGYVKFWHGVPVSSQNSQHIADWYTFSHIIHGFIFYWLIDWLTPDDWPLALKLILAVLPEIAWELFENTDWVINYYRANTISLDYFGDSVINSVSDISFMVVGFFAAYWLPWWAVVLLILGFEAVCLHYIRDNLTLNMLIFIHPFDTIVDWQAGR